MPKGPQGQWRPADPIAAAVHVGRIAIGEIEETCDAPRRPDPAADSRRASAAGKARGASLTPEQRSASAKNAAAARWS